MADDSDDEEGEEFELEDDEAIKATPAKAVSTNAEVEGVVTAAINHQNLPPPTLKMGSRSNAAEPTSVPVPTVNSWSRCTHCS